MAEEDYEMGNPDAEEGLGPCGCRWAAERDVCPDCGGTGEIKLLVSTVPCTTCGGSGSLGEVPSVTWTTVSEYEKAAAADELETKVVSYNVYGPNDGPMRC